jgi:hypothetical protein
MSSTAVAQHRLSTVEIQLPVLGYFLSSEHPATELVQLSTQLQRHFFLASLAALNWTANAQLT